MANSEIWELEKVRLIDNAAAPTTGFDDAGAIDHGIVYLRGGLLYYKQPDGTEKAIGEASALADLSDVGVTTPTNRNILVADGDSWESRALVLADLPSVAIDDLSDVVITGAVKGDILVFNGTNWVDLTVGTNDHVLTADSAQAEGIKWAAGAGGGSLNRARIYDDSGTTLTSTTGSLIMNGGYTEDIDVSSYIDLVSDDDRITIPTSENGDYLITYGFRVDVSTGTPVEWYASLDVIQNVGNTVIAEVGTLRTDDTNTSDGNTMSLSGADIQTLAVADYLRLRMNFFAPTGTDAISIGYVYLAIAKLS